MWYTIVYIFESVIGGLDDFIGSDAGVFMFLPATIGFLIYIWTIVRGFVWKPKIGSAALVMRLRHLKSLYGVRMQMLLMITIVWFSFYIYITLNVMESWSSNPDWMFFVVEGGKYGALMVLWAASLLFVFRTVFYVRRKSLKPIRVWMIIKRELMLSGSIIFAIIIGFVIAMVFYVSLDHTSEQSLYGGPVADKPVIYLYPETITDVTVELDYDGTLIADYPPYDESIGGWQVTAEPDGTLINHADGREYSYLFWEGQSAEPIDWDLSTGFVVQGSETRKFLQEKLAEIGLTPREYNEFIVYWYPKMKDNPYNLIHFAGEQYTDTAPLTIVPPADSILRVFIVYQPLTQPIGITPQTFEPFERTGFTVVEWGGTEL